MLRWMRRRRDRHRAPVVICGQCWSPDTDEAAGLWRCWHCGYEWGDGAQWNPRRLVPPPPTRAEWDAVVHRPRRRRDDPYD